jgi:hypothetical protein
MNSFTPSLHTKVKIDSVFEAHSSLEKLFPLMCRQLHDTRFGDTLCYSLCVLIRPFKTFKIKPNTYSVIEVYLDNPWSAAHKGCGSVAILQ